MIKLIYKLEGVIELPPEEHDERSLPEKLRGMLVALHEANVPCVLTAHDYKLVCPSYSLHDGNSQCFAYCGQRYWNVLVRGCSRKGRGGDLALAVEAYVHHFLRVYERNVNVIIAPRQPT